VTVSLAYLEPHIGVWEGRNLVYKHKACAGGPYGDADGSHPAR
jgi:hypothetical protein